MTFADHVLTFNKSLKLDKALPAGVTFMNPYQDANAFQLCENFYKKYYSDVNERTLIFGINPGRFGGGVTGIPFTDPVKLATLCDIPNALQKKVELSADFIYKMIDAYGGVAKFYHKFYISAVCPLGFTKDNKNLNYYDIKELKQAMLDFSINCLQAQLTFSITREVCFCLGEGENFKFLTAINQKYNFFKRIIPLPHPRFVMQYRRKRIDEFITVYIEKLNGLF